MPSFISTGGHLLEFRKFPSRFGTSPRNEIVIQPGLGVMPHHFTLHREADAIILESAGQGATTVNGDDVRRANLRDGDRIQVGQLMLIYSYPEGILESDEPEQEDRPILTRAKDPLLSPEDAASSQTKPDSQDAPVRGHQKPDTRQMIVSDVMTGFSQGMDNPFGQTSSSPGPEAADDFPGPDDPPSDNLDEDLAEVFTETDCSSTSTTPDSVPTQLPNAPLPALPDIEEAERAGAAVVAPSGLPGSEIQPAPLRPKRSKPRPPARKGAPKSHVQPQAAAAATTRGDGSTTGDAAAPTTGESFAPPASGDRVADRLARDAKPGYGLLIPWHKLGIFLCVVFALVGAFLAKSRHEGLERYLVGLLGGKSPSEHGNYLRQMGELEPSLLFTGDASRLVKLYEQGAGEADWIRLEEIESRLESQATMIDLADLDRVSVGMNAQGGLLALISSKSKLKRPRIIRDLVRGPVSEERFGEIAVYEGVLGVGSPVKFALMDPWTLAIGDPDMITRFVLTPPSPPAGEPPIAEPGHALADSLRDLAGLYHVKGALGTLKDLLPDDAQPAAERLFGFLRSGETVDAKVLTRIGVDLRLQATLDFASDKEAKLFADNWSGRVAERLEMLRTMLGPKAKSLNGARHDLDRCIVTTKGDRVNVKLAVANRWAALSPLEAKNMAIALVTAFQNPVAPLPELMTAEERHAREAARLLTHRYERARTASAPQLDGVRDIAAIVRLLAEGVRGEGPYRNVTYRVEVAPELLDRVTELLAWSDGEEQRLVVRRWKPTNRQPRALGNALSDGGPAEDL